jgi:hypothetical protein
MRALIITTCLITAFPLAATVAQTASKDTATTPAKYSTSETDIGTLLDDPAARAVLDKYLPSVSHGDQIDMARSMTLKDIQQYAPDVVTDKVLAQVDAELSKLPAKK